MKLIFMIMILNVMTANVIAQTELSIPDTRDQNTYPVHYNAKLAPYFKSAGAVGLPITGAPYYTVVGLRGWHDDTGGKAHELAFGDDNIIHVRSGYTSSWGGWRQLVSTDEAGNVGIGTLDTKGYKLAVNGNIRTKEVKVEATNWPDYVFKPAYKLPTLYNVKNYVD